jgi:cell division protein FtsB
VYLYIAVGGVNLYLRYLALSKLVEEQEIQLRKLLHEKISLDEQESQLRKLRHAQLYLQAAVGTHDPYNPLIL